MVTTFDICWPKILILIDFEAILHRCSYQIWQGIEDYFNLRKIPASQTVYTFRYCLHIIMCGYDC